MVLLQELLGGMTSFHSLPSFGGEHEHGGGETEAAGEGAERPSKDFTRSTTLAVSRRGGVLAVRAVLLLLLQPLLLALLMLLSVFLVCLSCSTLSSLTRFPVHDSQVCLGVFVIICVFGIRESFCVFGDFVSPPSKIPR